MYLLQYCGWGQYDTSPSMHLGSTLPKYSHQGNNKNLSISVPGVVPVVVVSVTGVVVVVTVEVLVELDDVPEDPEINTN
jgi:hypothetical protein